MSRLCQRVLGVLLAGALTACAFTRYPTPSELPLVLDAQSNPAWHVETLGRSGGVQVTFRALESSHCSRTLMTLSLRENHRSRRSMDALSVLAEAMPNVGFWALSARFRDGDDNLSSVYDDRGLPLGQDNVIEVRWRNKRELRVVVNGEVFVDDGFGERVRFVELTSHCGAVEIVDVKEV
ncbi:hypothetical protein [Marinimicrobium alkaliphilum]|uniref:hypothetical protein n=1 Tax=Marinimicrobium alkaliphilum TaxID=2202654 RepID=UPI0013007605|nr:hypothetical protein [Marinimicrobium alkaliphilum]